MKTGRSLGDIPAFRGEFQATGSGHEYRSRDGRRFLDVELHAQGLRDLHASILKMAQQVSRDKRAARGIVAVWTPRLSDDRIRGEWGATLSLFKPAIACRMALVVARPDRCLTLGEDRELQRIGQALRAHLGARETPARESKPALSRTFFEIFKILLHRWLLQQGPIAIGELMRQSACSYPSVADALRRLEAAEEVARRSNRSVQLSRFPQKTWSEVLALSDSLRRTQHYVDSSGRKSDPGALQRRLEALPHDKIAVGGVQAARQWDSHFDLNGVPRLDVIEHRPGGVADSEWVRRLDPALQPAKANAANIVLATRSLLRKEPLFKKNPKGRVPWADPVETLLDLHELGLVEQAEAMVRRLEGRA